MFALYIMIILYKRVNNEILKVSYYNIIQIKIDLIKDKI